MRAPISIDRPDQIESIASPGRETIVDTVALLGPLSIPQLARALGRSRHGLYYHVKALRDVGLLTETRRSGDGVRATAYYDVPGRPMWISFDHSTEPRRKAVLALATARMRAALRGFKSALTRGGLAVTGPRRNLWATHLKGWLSEAELEEANRLLGRLIELVGSPATGPHDGRKPYELTFVLYPRGDARRDAAPP